jgi:integrase
MSRNPIARCLDVLTASGYLEVRHVGNAKMYHLVERLPVEHVLSMSREMTAFLDSDHRIVRASDSFALVNGCRPGDILRTRLQDLPLRHRGHRTRTCRSPRGEHGLPAG